MSLQTTLETKVPDFVSTMSRTIKCNHCSKLFVNQQGLFVKNIKIYCIYRCFNTQTKIISIPFKISASALFLKFRKFRKFQPRYSYKIYSYKKKKKECRELQQGIN